MWSVEISSSGELSIPAELRERWGVPALMIEDCGDHLVIRPEEAGPTDPDSHKERPT